MPEGIAAQEAYPAEIKSRFLKWLRVTGRYEYDTRDLAEMAEALRVFYARESIVITRKTKRGMGEMDIRPAIRELTVTPEADFVRIEAVISAQEPTLNPEHLVTALRQLDETIAPDFAAFRREEVYHEDGGVFR